MSNNDLRLIGEYGRNLRRKGRADPSSYLVPHWDDVLVWEGTGCES